MSRTTVGAARQQAIQQAQRYCDARPLFLDTETTGKDPYTADIVEISIVDFEGTVLLDTLVNPGRSIPRDVIAIHGITDQMVQGAPTWREIGPAVAQILANRHVGIYNSDYDVRVLQGCHRRTGLAWQVTNTKFFCVMKLYAQFRGEIGQYGDFRWHRLEHAGQHCGIELPNAHRACADGLLTRAVLLHMAGCS